LFPNPNYFIFLKNTATGISDPIDHPFLSDTLLRTMPAAALAAGAIRKVVVSRTTRASNPADPPD
jgi:hypothetical protein